MKNPKVVDISEVKVAKRTSPATRIIESLDGEYYTMRQTAEMIDVHIETLRRICRTSRVKAPSKATTQGQLVIYLFTPEDVEEVREYFHGKDEQQEKGAKNHANSKSKKVR